MRLSEHRCVRNTITSVEFPGFPQHARRDIEATVAYRVERAGEIQEIGGLVIQLDRTPGGRIDPVDNIAVEVAAEFIFDTPCFRGDGRTDRTGQILAGAVEQHFTWAAHCHESAGPTVPGWFDFNPPPGRGSGHP